MTVSSLRMPNIFSLYYHRQLLWNFICRDLKSRYVGSTMGLFWSVINPLLLLILFTYVFAIILQIRIGQQAGITGFAFYFFAGFLPWNALQESLMRSTTSITDNATLIKNVRFPAKIFPFYLTISSLINELIGIGILVIAVFIKEQQISPYLALLPIVIVFQLLFTVGLGWLLATIHVFFRDTAQIMGLGLTFWMFLTPIFYPESLVPERFSFLISINPMAYLVRIYRNICLEGRLPDFNGCLFFVFIALITMGIGYTVFTRNHYKFADHI
jgi:ABC-type polysaccharide/polyol phosphate export permease